MRTIHWHHTCRLSLAWLALSCIPLIGQSIPPISRKLPPIGIALPQQIAMAIDDDLAASKLQSSTNPNINIFSKAIRYARLHQEFYKPQDAEIPARLLAEARRRHSDPDWGKPSPGLIVRGYTSAIDGSAQPYGLEIPEGLDPSKPAALWVWLHGRGDKETDMHFIHNRMRKRGQFQPANAMVLHPFGRQCVGWKWAGEIDVFEAIEDVTAHYEIDRDRIALMGFSMGGAGAWHIGAHYPDAFACVHAGAGFAETREYNKLKPDEFPPTYEQILWKLYDVPNYARNFLTSPLIAYSGEKDKQIQAARVMETALRLQDYELHHVIGSGMGHKYDDKSRAIISKFVTEAIEKGRPQPWPQEVHLQSPTLRYARNGWLEITGLDKHWQDSRVDAVFSASGHLRIATKNVASLHIHLPADALAERQVAVTIDDQDLKSTLPFHVSRAGDAWRITEREQEQGLRKSPKLQGPIDDAFMAPFLFVTPTQKSNDPAVQRWIEFESRHQAERWRALFRGDVRTKPASEVTADDINRYNLILWGDRDMNPLIASTIDSIEGVEWGSKNIAVGASREPALGRILTLIYPNPENPKRYVVLNSGPTFREAHDRTNSLQNPKLPDWAIIGLEQPPSANAPGVIHHAGFFDERWRP